MQKKKKRKHLLFSFLLTIDGSSAISIRRNAFAIAASIPMISNSLVKLSRLDI